MVVAAVAAMALLVAIDIADGEHVVIVGVVIGPILAAVAASARTVAILAATALALALLSGLWNDNAGDGDWLIRAAVVAAGAASAYVLAQGHDRERTQLARMRLLAELGEVATGVGTVEEVAGRIAGVLVPGFADAVAVEVVRGGAPERVAIAGDATLLDGDVQTVALQTRGGTRGALTFAAAGRRLAADEVEFAGVAAGRAALALDNAGLSSELTIAERQLGAALSTLAEAVTVQDAAGRLVYANHAAAELLGYESAAEVVAQTGRQIASEFESTHADGRPLHMDELPGRRVLAGEEPEPLLIRAFDRRTGDERWRVIKASAVRDDTGKIRFAVNVIDDVTDVKRAELTQRLLAEASLALSSSLDVRETLQRVAEVGVPDLADWCTVHVPAESGVIELVGIAHSDPEAVEAAHEVARRFPARVEEPGGVAQVMRTGEPQLVREISPDALEAIARGPDHLESLRAAGIRSAMAVPMRAAERVIGVITFVNSADRRRFDAADLELALDIGRRAGIAAENARLYAQQSHIARTLQTELRPPALPDLLGWATAALYRPAGEGAEVGGDFYDVVEVDDGWVLIVGDVAGRGPLAASLTAMARYTLRTAAALTGSLPSAVALLNRTLYERPRMALCSACLVHVHGGEREGEVSLVAAGHPDPFLIRDGEPRSTAVGGPLLGALSRGDWPVVRLRLRPGDALVVYTDGVTDTQGVEDRFGEQRLAAILAGAGGAADVVERIGAALDDFASGRHPDDTAVLALERLGERIETPDENRHRTRLPAERTAPAAARAAVATWLAGVLSGEQLDAVRLMVSELVTNGVVHGTRRVGDGLDLEVRVTPSRVRVEVRNPGPAFTPGPEREVPVTQRGGRGLILVRRLADRWGVERGDRTCVWFEVAR